jgi:uncharacterized protein YcsI (UPF0317 family)
MQAAADMTTTCDTAQLSPANAREAFRSGTVTPTAAWAYGYAQANLVTVPVDWAYDVLLFAQRNRHACPVLDVTDPGSPRTSLAAGADLRTDIPRYRVWRDGVLVDEPSDVTTVWRDDLVSFLLGCSFTFDNALREAGVPLRHVEGGTNVPMYRTNRSCRSAGRLRGPLVVSMRPVRADLIPTAVQVTAQMPDMHGAPVHVGDPTGLGIADLNVPDYGGPVEIRDGEIPVFWACGVTPQAALEMSAPPFAITHAPGHMFITDMPDTTYRTPLFSRTT